jgi:hypothetical protein
MTAQSSGLSTRALARLAGLLLLLPPGAPFGEFFVRGRLIVPGDAAATANNIVANEFLWRLGGVADLEVIACDVGLAVIFFTLFVRVSLPPSLAVALFRFVGAVMYAVVTALHFWALSFLGSSPIKGVPAEVLQAQAMAALRLHGIGVNVAHFFFGISCIALGTLIWRSRFLPRLIALWVGLAGIGYLAQSVVHFLAPAYGAAVFRYLTVPAGIGELILGIWLLAFGVNEERWKEQVGASEAWGEI